MENLSAIDRAVLATINYFDIFEYPLTATEIFHNLLSTEPVSPTEVLTTLNNLKAFVLNDEGFYFLPGRAEIINIRKERYLLAEKKFRVVEKNINLLKKLPFIRAIFICNKLAYSNSRATGDIDLAIIVKNKRIWTARFFSALTMKILNRRPQKNNQQNKICLSFFLDENFLDLQDYALEKDWHFAFWIRQFLPIYDPANYYEKLQKANSWVSRLLPNYLPCKLNDRRRIDVTSNCQKFFEFILPNITERFFKRLQLRFLNKNLVDAAVRNDKSVVINDNILKLHVTDRRQEYNQELKKRLDEIQK